MDNKEVNHQKRIIKMEGKLHDQVVSFFIDPGSNYSYVSPDLVYECGLNKKSAWRILVDAVGYRDQDEIS